LASISMGGNSDSPTGEGGGGGSRGQGGSLRGGSRDMYPVFRANRAAGEKKRGMAQCCVVRKT